jgi:hypothetical protein
LCATVFFLGTVISDDRKSSLVVSGTATAICCAELLFVRMAPLTKSENVSG